jgi:hypothetical protein
MKYLTADTEFPIELIKNDIIPCSLFIGGTIDDGKSWDFQKYVTETLKNLPISNKLIILNPRDSDWDLTIKQTDSEPKFRKQVNWEQDGLKYSSLIFMHFIGGSRSIISMSELGQYCNSGKLIVSADPNYFKRGNIEVLSRRYGFPLYDNLDDGLKSCINRLTP